MEQKQANVSAAVVADVFERGSAVPAGLLRLGARVTIEPLAAGDYRVPRGVIVERKTVADLHGSLGRGRLWAQVGRVRDEAVSPFLLVEGEDLDAGPQHPNAIRGALLAIADLGVALRQARKAQGQTLRADTPHMAPPGVAVLAAVPGISDRSAQTLLERFGSVLRAAHGHPARGRSCSNIGRACREYPKLASLEKECNIGMR